MKDQMMKMLRVGIDSQNILSDVELLNEWTRQKEANQGFRGFEGIEIRRKSEEMKKIEEFYASRGVPKKAIILKGFWGHLMEEGTHHSELNSIIRVKYPVPAINQEGKEQIDFFWYFANHISKIIAGVVQSYQPILEFSSIVSHSNRATHPCLFFHLGLSFLCMDYLFPL